jgi:hypothetical protein
MYRDYLAWFHDVSGTRGYGPIRIEVGGNRENPTLLTRQDRRGQGADERAEGVGCWELQVIRAGRYEVVVHVAESRTDSRLHLAIGKVSLEEPLNPMKASQSFSAFTLNAGPATVQAWSERDGVRTGVLDVTVSRVGDD